MPDRALPSSSRSLTSLTPTLDSAISLDQCVRNLAAFTSIPISKAIRCATWNVAQMLGGEVAKTKGALLDGMDADLVVLDEDGFVLSTWVMGLEVWKAEGTLIGVVRTKSPASGAATGF